MMEKRYHNVKWPSITFESPIDVIPHMIKRFNEASDIYQMFGVLCEVMIFSEDDKQVTYLQVKTILYISVYMYNLRNLVAAIYISILESSLRYFTYYKP